MRISIIIPIKGRGFIKSGAYMNAVAFFLLIAWVSCREVRVPTVPGLVQAHILRGLTTTCREKFNL